MAVLTLGLRVIIDKYWDNPSNKDFAILPGTDGPLPLSFVRALEEFRGIAIELDRDALPLLVNGRPRQERELEMEMRPSKNGHIRLTSPFVKMGDTSGRFTLCIFMCPVGCPLPEHKI